MNKHSHDNIYSILGKLAAINAKDQVAATPVQSTKAKSRLVESMDTVESRLSKQFAESKYPWLDSERKGTSDDPLKTDIKHKVDQARKNPNNLGGSGDMGFNANGDDDLNEIDASTGGYGEWRSATEKTAGAPPTGQSGQRTFSSRDEAQAFADERGHGKLKVLGPQVTKSGKFEVSLAEGKATMGAAVKRSEEAAQRIERKKAAMRKKGFSEKEIKQQFDESAKSLSGVNEGQKDTAALEKEFSDLKVVYTKLTNQMKNDSPLSQGTKLADRRDKVRAKLNTLKAEIQKSKLQENATTMHLRGKEVNESSNAELKRLRADLADAKRRDDKEDIDHFSQKIRTAERKAKKALAESANVDTLREKLSKLQADLKSVKGSGPGDDRNRSLIRSDISDVKDQIKNAKKAVDEGLNVHTGKWANTDNGTVDFEAGGLLRKIGAVHNNSLERNYTRPTPAPFSTLKNSKLKSLRDAYNIITQSNPNLSDEEIHDKLVSHWSGIDEAEYVPSLTDKTTGHYRAGPDQAKGRMVKGKAYGGASQSDEPEDDEVDSPKLGRGRPKKADSERASAASPFANTGGFPSFGKETSIPKGRATSHSVSDAPPKGSPEYAEYAEKQARTAKRKGKKALAESYDNITQEIIDLKREGHFSDEKIAREFDLPVHVIDEIWQQYLHDRSSAGNPLDEAEYAPSLTDKTTGHYRANQDYSKGQVVKGRAYGGASQSDEPENDDFDAPKLGRGRPKKADSERASAALPFSATGSLPKFGKEVSIPKASAAKRHSVSDAPPKGSPEYAEYAEKQARVNARKDRASKKAPSLSEQMQLISRRLTEGVNFKAMAETTHQSIDELMSELQQDISAYKSTGRCSEKLRDFLDVHSHGKKQMADESSSITPPGYGKVVQPTSIIRTPGSDVVQAGPLRDVLPPARPKQTRDPIEHELNELARLAGLPSTVDEEFGDKPDNYGHTLSDYGYDEEEPTPYRDRGTDDAATDLIHKHDKLSELTHLAGLPSTVNDEITWPEEVRDGHSDEDDEDYFDPTNPTHFDMDEDDNEDMDDDERYDRGTRRNFGEDDDEDRDDDERYDRGTRRNFGEDGIEFDEPRIEPVNRPKPEYKSMKQSTLNPGEGDNGEKKMYPRNPMTGDNRMAKQPTLESRLAAEYESIKKVAEGSIKFDKCKKCKKEPCVCGDKKPAKKVTEGKVKELSQDLKSAAQGGIADDEFKKKYNKTKAEVRQSLAAKKVSEGNAGARQYDQTQREKKAKEENEKESSTKKAVDPIAAANLRNLRMRGQNYESIEQVAGNRGITEEKAKAKEKAAADKEAKEAAARRNRVIRRTTGNR
jgi:hypothetical protein